MKDFVEDDCEERKCYDGVGSGSYRRDGGSPHSSSGKPAAGSVFGFGDSTTGAPFPSPPGTFRWLSRSTSRTQDFALFFFFNFFY